MYTDGVIVAIAHSPIGLDVFAGRKKAKFGMDLGVLLRRSNRCQPFSVSLCPRLAKQAFSTSMMAAFLTLSSILVAFHDAVTITFTTKRSRYFTNLLVDKVLLTTEPPNSQISHRLLDLSSFLMMALLLLWLS